MCPVVFGGRLTGRTELNCMIDTCTSLPWPLPTPTFCPTTPVFHWAAKLFFAHTYFFPLDVDHVEIIASLSSFFVHFAATSFSVYFSYSGHCHRYTCLHNVSESDAMTALKCFITFCACFTGIFCACKWWNGIIYINRMCMQKTVIIHNEMVC